MRSLILAAGFAVASHAAVPVLTRAYDNNRSGANVREFVLTQASVKTKGVRRLTTIPVYGDARGIEAQPLILPGVQTQQGPHDVMVLASMANTVRGVDARTGAAIWDVSLGTPIVGSAAIDMHRVNDHWGVLSTGVIDPDTQRVYLVSWVSPDGSAAKAAHYMNVLSVKDGTQVVPPIPLAGAVSGTQHFNSTMRKQRSSLLLTQVNGRKTIYFASGTVLETQAGAAGWVFAFDVASNTLSALALSQGRGAGVWMSGQGLAADSAGNVYGVTGNGSFDGVSDFGETVFRLKGLKVVDHWTPYTDAERLGDAPPVDNKIAGASGPTEAAKMPVNGAHMGYGDEDLGSGGATLIEKYGIYLASGKDGLSYAVRALNMGGTMPGDFANAKANCAKLATPPVWIAASPGPVDPCPQDATTLDFMPWGRTRHMHSTPVQYWSPSGLKLFVWGENSQLHEWAMTPSGALTYVAQGEAYASANVTASPGGMPGGFCTLSLNHNTAGSALLWCTVPLGDANAEVTQGRLICYDPDHAQGGVIPVLWDSQAWNITFTFNKFLPPVVDGGQVYVANYSGGVDVYGP